MRIPISLLKKNVETGCGRNAARCGQFYFKKPAVPEINIINGISINNGIDHDSSRPSSQTDDIYETMSIDEIFNGKGKYGGLLSYIRRFLDEQAVNGPSRQQADDYLRLFSKRASGELLTPASWMRRFIMSHPEYKGDSVVSETVTYDLIWKLTQISRGEVHDPTLLPGRYH